MSIGQELLNVPMGDMIRQMAFAIAEGQMQLDSNSIEVAEMMGGLKVVHDQDGKPTFDDSRVFFGYEMMTIDEANAYIAADIALTGGNPAALQTLIDAQRTTHVQEAIVEASGKLATNATDAVKTAAATAATTKANAELRSERLIRVPTRLSMLELGFTPTFYQFVDTIIEVKIAIKITRETQSTVTTRTNSNTYAFSRRGGLFRGIFGGTVGGSNTVSTSQVDATYSAKYGYSAEGASLLRTRLAPLPPPPVLEDRIRRQMEEDSERRKRALEARLPAPAAPVTPA